MTTFKLKHFGDCYCSHQPVLIAAAMACSGPILELGAGFGSTELLHRIAQVRDVKMVTIEAEALWADKFQHLANSQHELRRVPAWDGSYFADLAVPAWGLVFVDQGLWEDRVRAVEFFKDKADLLILHDSDWFASHNTPFAEETPEGRVYHFRYWKEFVPPCEHRLPPTTVVSQLHDFEITPDWDSLTVKI